MFQWWIYFEFQEVNYKRSDVSANMDLLIFILSSKFTSLYAIQNVQFTPSHYMVKGLFGPIPYNRIAKVQGREIGNEAVQYIKN
jgi:hypothetical protein